MGAKSANNNQRLIMKAKLGSPRKPFKADLWQIISPLSLVSVLMGADFVRLEVKFEIQSSQDAVGVWTGCFSNIISISIPKRDC